MSEWNAPWAHENLFTGNIFIDNGVNAWDDGIDNQWGGNYWDDYSGVDLNDDGIGDTPYNIPGSAGSQDNYPIWDDGDTPVSFVIDDDVSNGRGDYTWAEAALEPWCSGSGTELEPYVITNLILDAGGGNCITIRDSTEYFIISNCMIFNSTTGIYILNVQNGNIIKNEIDNTRNGIHLEGSSQNTILNNTIKSFMPTSWTYGIYLKEGSNNNVSSNDITNGWSGLCLEDSSSNIVSNNTVRESYYGFMVESSFQNELFNNSIVDAQAGFFVTESWSNTLSNNTALRNGFGFLLLGSSANILTENTANENVRGIQLDLFSQDNNITQNTASNNEKYGICLTTSCNNNTITGNTAINNEIYGIYLKSNCNDNTITGNFAGNIGTSDQDIGIYLESNCDFNNITGNNCTGNIYGFYLETSDNNTLSENTVDIDVYGDGYGFYLSASDNNTLSGNTVYVDSDVYVYGYGFYLSASDNNTLSENTVYVDSDGYGYGFYLSASDNNTLSGNTVYVDSDGDGYGFYLSASDNNTLSENTVDVDGYHKVYSYGFYLIGSHNNTLSGNTVYASQDDVGNIISFHLRWSHNNTLSGNTVDVSGFVNIYGFNLDHSHNNTLLGNTVDIKGSGNIRNFYLDDESHNNTLSGNTVYIYTLGNNNIYASGFYLYDSDNNTLSGNTIVIDGSGPGYVDGFYLYWSHDNTLSGNTIVIYASGLSGVWGFYLYMSHINTLSGNTIDIYAGGYDNIWIKGFSLSGSDNNILSGNNVNIFGSGHNNGQGFGLGFSHNNILSGNIIVIYVYGDGYGFYLGYSHNNTLSGNTVKAGDYGFYLEASSHNLIFHNNLIDNLVQGIDFDPRFGNYWYHPVLLEGNYWSDYPGEDIGGGIGKHAIAGDGIGDTNLPWPAAGYDYYPFMNEIESPPTVYQDSATDVTLAFDDATEEGSISVTVSDIGPDPQSGFRLAGQYYEITTTVSYSGTITIAIPYDEILVGDENFLTLLHYNETSGEWEDITVFIDKINNIIYGEVESLSIFALFIDIAPPSITVETPGEDEALQDGIEFTGKAEDLSGVIWVNLTIREDDGANGIFIHNDFENMSAAYDKITKEWQLFFDTTELPDGFYLLIVESSDRFGLIGVNRTSVSIRNWAVLVLLPATEDNNPGRTMPIKFSLRVAEAVDPNTPFVRNEEITILIYIFGKPNNILHNASYGDTSKDYRIDSVGELYITNYKTEKKPQTYVVEVWRNGMLIDSFQFDTDKGKRNLQDSGDSSDDSMTVSLEIVQNFNKLYLYTYLTFGIFAFIWVIAETLKFKKVKKQS